MGYQDGLNLYAAYMGLDGRDPWGAGEEFVGWIYVGIDKKHEIAYVGSTENEFARYNPPSKATGKGGHQHYKFLTDSNVKLHAIPVFAEITTPKDRHHALLLAEGDAYYNLLDDTKPGGPGEGFSLRNDPDSPPYTKKNPKKVREWDARRQRLKPAHSFSNRVILKERGTSQIDLEPARRFRVSTPSPSVAWKADAKIIRPHLNANVSIVPIITMKGIAGIGILSDAKYAKETWNSYKTKTPGEIAKFNRLFIEAYRNDDASHMATLLIEFYRLPPLSYHAILTAFQNNGSLLKLLL